MGWHGIKLPKYGWYLYTRGGTCGVFIKNENSDEEIDIPQSLLRDLVASDIQSQRISELEQATTDEILGLKTN